MSTWPSSIIIHTDGASRGNPGPASIGICVHDTDGNLIDEHARMLGRQTNNFAEYTAVKEALARALERGAKHVVLRSDSQLLIRQLRGEYAVRSPTLKPLYTSCRSLAEKFESIEFTHVRREENARADGLANYALDHEIEGEPS